MSNANANAKSKQPGADGEKFVEVDIVAFMNCIRPRGPKFSVNRKRIMKLVDEAAAKAENENRQLKNKITQLESELRKMKAEKKAKKAAEEVVETPKEAGSDLPRKKRKSDPISVPSRTDV